MNGTSVAAGRQARIVGVHTTEQSRDLSHRTGVSLALEAIRGAAHDAGIDVAEIDGISTTLSHAPPGGHTFWARQIGTPMRWAGISSGIPAIASAVAAIEHGVASTVAIAVGMSRDRSSTATAAWTRPEEEFTAWTGSYTAVQYALVAQRYLHLYGEAALLGMAEASATIRNFGSENPAAVYRGRGPFSAQDVLDSRMVASPLTLLMCSSVNDGGAAMILTSADRARDCRKPAVRVLGAADQQPYPPYVDPPLLDAVPDEGAFARRMLASTGLSVADLDLLALYDQFAIGVLLQLEMIGLCGTGEASDFVRSGALGITGSHPTCTDGGNHSFSHNGAPTLFRPIEAVRQLRGEVPDGCTAAGRPHSHADRCRAVRAPEVALVSNPGPPTGGGSFAVLGLC